MPPIAVAVNRHPSRASRSGGYHGIVLLVSVPPVARIVARWLLPTALLWLAACSPEPKTSMPILPNVRKDAHSYSNPDRVRVTRVELDLDVLFNSKSLQGSVTLSLRKVDPAARELVLDTRDLMIEHVEAGTDSGAFEHADFAVGGADPILGAPLIIALNEDTTRVRVSYGTRLGASGLQWLEPSQTAGGRHPFLYTQSQAIHARSWIPLQDTPGVRVTYAATVRTPKDLLAVMSAEMEARSAAEAPSPGTYHFQMPQPIPSYLIALAVGDLVFEPMSQRTGVYAEPPVVGKAVREFDDTEDMMQAVEKLYGPYQWQRYDILVLPPSFPFGGMENPRLTFATPTILAGDKSLVSLVAHELAHSWSGNLVTNATWSDFWLNEGFTVYLERRIQERVFGRERSEMEGALEVNELQKELKDLEPRDQRLYVALDGRDPDDGFTLVPYIKGALFLRSLEEAVGRDRFDTFLRGYFDRFSFQSVTTADFLEYLDQYLLQPNPHVAEQVPIEQWLLTQGIPQGTARPESDLLEDVEGQAQRWTAGEVSAKDLPVTNWSTQQWLHFLRSVGEAVEPAKLAELDEAFSLTETGNSEIIHEWLLMAVRNEYEPTYPRLEDFLTSVGRRKFLKPLYTELAKTEDGKRRALAIYKKARALYHPIAVATIDEVLLAGDLTLEE